jgi:hypothetical protein
MTDDRIGHYIGDGGASKRGSSGLPRRATMAHLADKTHHLDRAALARVNSAIVFGLVSIGVLACAMGAIWFDVVHLFSCW